MGIFQDVSGFGMKTTHYVIESEKVPESFSGMKIVHLSDFHCKPKKGIVSIIKNEKPDLIFMSGDMVDDKKPYDVFLKLLEALVKLAPVYIVSGNHDALRRDYGKLVETCREMGAIYLVDQYAMIKKGADEIYIYGINDPAIKSGKMADDKIKESVSSLERHEGYEILLFHRANKLKFIEQEGFDVVFSGHMHGGQIRLPYFGGVLAPKSSFGDKDRMIFPKYTGGRYKLGKTDVIVSCGMGNPVKLPRFGNPTEIVSVILRKTT